MPLSQICQEQSPVSYCNLSELLYTAPPTNSMLEEVQTGTQILLLFIRHRCLP